MSSSNLHCYIITSTDLKEKHTLEQDVLFCCIIIRSELKECQSQAKQIVAITTQGWKKKKMFVLLLLQGSGLLIHLLKNQLLETLQTSYSHSLTYSSSPHLVLNPIVVFFFLLSELFFMFVGVFGIFRGIVCYFCTS